MDLLAFILAISAEGITDEQVQTALNAYIAEHPEAVTTVTDGSITKAKLDSNLQGTVDDVGVLKSAIPHIMLNNNIFVEDMWIASNGKWAVSSGMSFYVFAIKPGEEISIKSGTLACRYTLLEEYSTPVAGVEPIYATGYSQMTSQGDEFTITAPNNAHFLIIGNYTNGDVLPMWVKRGSYNYVLTNAENFNNYASNTKLVNTFPTSGYVNSSGAVVVSGTWVTTDYYPYESESIKSIYIKAYQSPGTNEMASFYDANKNYVYGIDTIQNTSGSGKKEGYLSLSNVPATAKYVRFSTNNATAHYVVIQYSSLTDIVLKDSNLVTELKTNEIESNVRITSFNGNGYVNLQGEISAGGNWVYTDYMSAQNVQSIKSKAYQLPGTVALVAFYDEDKYFISAVDTYDGQTGNGVKEGTISISSIPSTAVFMRFSSYASTTNKYVEVKYNYANTIKDVANAVPDLKAEVSKLQTLENRLYGYPFSMTFIGDSLTYGQTYVHASGTSGYAYKNKANYPDVFCRMLGITDKTVIAIPGANPGGVWSEKSAEIGNIQNQFVIVWLGTNGGLTDTVDTDCAGNDVSQYANTNTGNYGKIVKTLVDHGNKVFLAQLCYTTHSTASNPVIADLAERFECSVLELSGDDISDLNQDKYHTAYNNYVNSVHFNSIGYNHVAEVFFSKMMALVYETPEDFEIYMADE